MNIRLKVLLQILDNGLICVFVEINDECVFIGNGKCCDKGGDQVEEHWLGHIPVITETLPLANKYLKQKSPC